MHHFLTKLDWLLIQNITCPTRFEVWESSTRFLFIRTLAQALGLQVKVSLIHYSFLLLKKTKEDKDIL